MEKLKNLPKDHISVSQLSSYRICERYYKYKYVDNANKTNRTDVAGLFLGSCVHEYQAKKIGDGVKNLDVIFYNKIKELFSEIVDSSQYDSTHDTPAKESFAEACLMGEYEQCGGIILECNSEIAGQYIFGYTEQLKKGEVQRPSLKEIYVNLCNMFDENDDMKQIKVEQREKEMIFEFERFGKSFKILAYLDVMGYCVDTPIVIDWKTSKSKWGESKVPEMQDLIYSYMVWKTLGIIPEFWYIVGSYSKLTGAVQKQKFIVKHTEESLSTVESVIHDYCKGINAGVFPRNETSWKCSEKYCEYFNDCQAYRMGIAVTES